MLVLRLQVMAGFRLNKWRRRAAAVKIAVVQMSVRAKNHAVIANVPAAMANVHVAIASVLAATIKPKYEVGYNC